MPALVIVLAFFGVNIALSAFGFIILYMPYAVGFLVSLILCNTNPAIQALIPGHPWMSFVSVLALTEALIAIMTHIKQISCSFIIFSCSVFTGLVGAIAFESMNPDSVAYCIFVSVVYLLLTGFALLLNMRNLPENVIYKTLPMRIISGIFYGLSVAIIFGVLTRGIWKPYFVNSGSDTKRIAFLLNVVCGVLAGAALLFTVFSRSGNREDNGGEDANS